MRNSLNCVTSNPTFDNQIMSELEIMNPQPQSSVGTLVWVRRRNGSWWPGRILAPEELPGSHLLSPRSGTPVKLLGRDDASVDWYNIEKSKRVKAFRCGEFDDCIERAKTFAGLPTKKREKYARREDAILHALQLEKQQTRQKWMCGLVPDEREAEINANRLDDRLSIVAHCNGSIADAAAHFVGSGSTMDVDFSVSKVPFGDLSESILNAQGKQKFGESDWEDDKSEAMPRMRGLQDFGLKIALSRSKKANYCSLEGGSKISLVEDDSRTISCFSNVIGSSSIANNSRGSLVELKRKRSHSGPTTEESAYKKRDRRRPLIQVLESSAKLSELDFHDFESASVQLGRETMTSLQHQEIKLAVEHFIDSDGRKSQFVRKCFKLGERLQGVHGSQDTSIAVSSVDKACASVSGSLNVSSCDWMPLYLPSSIGGPALPGSVLMNSLFSGGLHSPCSFLPVSISKKTAASVLDNGHHDSSFISLPSVEKFPHSKHSTLWPNSSFKEELCNKSYKEMALVHSSEVLPWTASNLHYHVNNVSEKNVLPAYLPHAENGCREHVLSASGFPTASTLEGDLIYSSTALLNKDTSSVHCDFTSHMPEENETDSFRASTAKECSVSKWQAKKRRSGRMPGRRHVNGFHECRLFSSAGDLDQEQEDQDKQHDLHWSYNLDKQESAKIDSAYAETLELKRPLQHEYEVVSSLRDHPCAISCSKTFGQNASFLSLSKWHERSRSHPENISGLFDSTSFLKTGLDAEELKHSNCYPQQEKKSWWLDVKVEVPAPYQRESVPLVSLMSRFNGRAVIGHPIVVDKLESRYKVTLSRATDKRSIYPETQSGGTARKVSLQPITARRTSIPCVPRSCRNVVGSAFDAGINPFLRQTGERFSKLGFSPYRRRLLSKNYPLVYKSLSRKKLMQKAGLSSQKTRALSSFTLDENVKHEFMESAMALDMPEQPLPMACIPVKLVFRRIKEVLYAWPKSEPSGNRCSVNEPVNHDAL